MNKVGKGFRKAEAGNGSGGTEMLLVPQKDHPAVLSDQQVPEHSCHQTGTWAANHSITRTSRNRQMQAPSHSLSHKNSAKVH